MKISDIGHSSGDRIGFDTFKALISNDFSEAWERVEAGAMIYKGMGDIPLGINFFKPIKNRKSANTNNFYTLVINEDPRFMEFPNRSVICSTSIAEAKGYANSVASLGIILPKNGTTIAICPSNDIWNTPIALSTRKVLWFYYGRLIESMINILGKNSHIKSYNDLLDLGDRAHQMLNDGTIDYESLKSKTKHELILSMLDEIFKRKDGMKTILKRFSPNDFVTQNIKSFSAPDNREVWFDSDFIAIRAEYIESLLGTK